jgi:hypothetical protein
LLIQFFYHESAEACMRGIFSDQGRLFSYISPEARVPANQDNGSVSRFFRKLLKRLHKYMREVEHISIVSDEMREVVEELWPELAHKLPPKRSRG